MAEAARCMAAGLVKCGLLSGPVGTASNDYQS